MLLVTHTRLFGVRHRFRSLLASLVLLVTHLPQHLSLSFDLLIAHIFLDPSPLPLVPPHPPLYLHLPLLNRSLALYEHLLSCQLVFLASQMWTGKRFDLSRDACESEYLPGDGGKLLRIVQVHSHKLELDTQLGATCQKGPPLTQPKWLLMAP